MDADERRLNQTAGILSPARRRIWPVIFSEILRKVRLRTTRLFSLPLLSYPRSSAFICGFFCLCFSVSAQIKPNDFVAITGDSITEQRQYSVYIEDYLLMCQPKLNARVMQLGWSGDTTVGFLSRVDNDCLRFKPTLVTMCFGMNDGGYQPVDDARLKKFRDATEALVDAFLKSGARVVLGSPGCVDVNTFRRDRDQALMYDKTLAIERDIAHDIADQKHVAFADVYDPMFSAMTAAEEKYGKDYHVAGADGVHPAANGHVVMAYAFLKAMGCDGDLATIHVDLADKKATASEGHTVVSFDGSRLMIESKRYPFCFPADHNMPTTRPDNPRGILPFVPFNDELNRFMLIVGNASPGARYKVTWGDSSKEFSAEELSHGINLAAELLDNPFTGPFKKIDEAVRAKQAFETIMVKELIHRVKFELPDEPKLLEEVAAATMRRRAELVKAQTDLFAPVTHTITIQEVAHDDDRK